MPVRHVYMIPILAGASRMVHPHVDLSGKGASRLVVPCFSRGGHYVNEHIELCRKQRMDDRDIFVLLDNATEIDWTEPIAPAESYWLLGRADPRCGESSVTSPVGNMKNNGVGMISRALIRRERSIRMLSPNMRAMLEQLRDECAAEANGPIASAPPFSQSPSASRGSGSPLGPSRPSAPQAAPTPPPPRS